MINTIFQLAEELNGVAVYRHLDGDGHPLDCVCSLALPVANLVLVYGGVPPELLLAVTTYAEEVEEA